MMLLQVHDGLGDTRRYDPSSASWNSAMAGEPWQGVLQRGVLAFIAESQNVLAAFGSNERVEHSKMNNLYSTSSTVRPACDMLVVH
jgi:hypothetical protein